MNLSIVFRENNQTSCTRMAKALGPGPWRVSAGFVLSIAPGERFSEIVELVFG